MANRKPQNTRMNEDLRRRIKRDIESGKTNDEVRRWYGVCSANVRFASLSNSMAEYYEIQKASKTPKMDQEETLITLAEKEPQPDHKGLRESIEELCSINQKIYDLLKKYMEV